MHADFGKPAPAQIGDEDVATGKFGAATQQTDGLFLAEVMERQREKHEIVFPGLTEVMDVGAMETNLGKPRA